MPAPMFDEAWKYVLFRTGDCIAPVIFSKAIVHKDVAEVTRFLLRSYPMPEVLSAGFIRGLNVEAAGGMSESLSVASSDQDAMIINLYGHSSGLWPKPA